MSLQAVQIEKRKGGGPVDRGRVPTLVSQLNFGPVGNPNPLTNLLEPLDHKILVLLCEGPHGSLQIDRVSDGIGGITSLHCAHGDHHGLMRINPSAHNGLDGGNECRAYRDRINRLVGHRSVPSLPLHQDGKAVAAREGKSKLINK